MKKRSDRLKKIIVVAKSEEKKQCQQLGRAQVLLDAEISRLSELESFRKTYEERAQSGGGVPASHWSDYQNFLQRLNLAIAEQQKFVLSGKENRDLHRRNWIAKKKRLDSLQRVVDRYRETEDREAERQMQKTLDDRPPAPKLFGD